MGGKIRGWARLTSMTALAQLAAFATLDAQTIDRLLAQHLVDTFVAHAIPDEPVDLDLLVVDAGAALVWRDPGAASFHAAAEFHWSVWAVSAEDEREVAAGVSRAPRARAEFAVEDADYQVRVYATNQCPGGAPLASSIAVTNATR